MATDAGVSRRQLLLGSAVLTAVAAACGVGGRGAQPAALTLSREPAAFAYWDWAAVWKDLVNQLAGAFMARHPQVKVDWQVMPEYWDKLQVAIAGGTGPDTWRMNGPNLPSWVTRGLLTDLTPLVARDRQVAADLKAMAPVFQEYTRRQSKQWSIPFGNAISGILAYNEGMVRAEGLTPPAELRERWQWPVLVDYAVKLTRRDGSRHGYHSDRGSEVGWLPYVYANGGAMFDKEGKKAVLNSPQTQDALQYVVDFVVKHRVSPLDDELAQENAESRFLNGRLAMVPRGSWEIKDLNLKARDLRWDLVPIPRAPGTSKNGSTSQLASVVLAPATKQQPAGWEWLKFIGSKAGQDIIARAEFFPGRVDSAEQIYYDPAKGPKSRPLLREVLAVTQPLPWTDLAGNTAGWGPIVNPLITQMFRGQISVKDGLQKAQDELTAAIARQFQ